MFDDSTMVMDVTTIEGQEAYDFRSMKQPNAYNRSKMLIDDAQNHATAISIIE